MSKKKVKMNDEQAMEVEALQSIYMEEFELVSESPCCFKVHFKVVTPPEDEDEDEEVECWSFPKTNYNFY